MKLKSKILSLCLMLTLSACGGSDSGPDITTEEPTPELAPVVSPAPGLFDVWTFKAVITSDPCSLAPSDVIEEEYRIFEKGGGCALDDKLEDGTALTNEKRLFVTANTNCQVDGATLTLTGNDQRQLAEGQCIITNTISVASPLQLNGDTLNGDYAATLTVTFSETCKQDTFNCSAKATITGTRGRNVKP